MQRVFRALCHLTRKKDKKANVICDQQHFFNAINSNRYLSMTKHVQRDIPSVVTSSEEILRLKRENMPNNSGEWRSFYDSSIGPEEGVGAIITDPAFFTIPLDDHGYNRGHAVFDTCNVMNGRAFGLNFHLDRLLKSCELARIEHNYDKEWLKNVVLHTIAASKKKNDVFVRYWMTSGRGDFGIVPSETTTKARFYCIVHDYDMKKAKQKEFGVKEVFVNDVPLKPKLLATVKSNNYMLNALLTLRAKETGGDLGIAIDQQGIIQESSIANFAIVTKDNILKTPKFDGILAGTSVKRAFDLKDPLLKTNLIKDFKFCNLTEEDAYDANEMMFFGGGYCVPIVEIQGRKVGNGKPGNVFKAIDTLLVDDMNADDETDLIPY